MPTNTPLPLLTRRRAAWPREELLLEQTGFAAWKSGTRYATDYEVAATIAKSLKVSVASLYGESKA